MVSSIQQLYKALVSSVYNIFVDVKYDPEIGMAGLQVSITLERPGFRIKKRKICKKKIKSNHQVSKKDAMAYMKSEFKLNFGKEAEQ